MQIADKTFALPFSEIGYRAPTFIFYTFDYSFFTEASGVYRNAGFAWEAGAFVIYVNLALIFNLFLNINNENIKVFSFKNLILILALITTFSTTGYIVFFITIIVFIWNSKSLSIYKYIVLGVFLFLSLTLYKSTEFLESKINSQIGEASISQNRFGAALLDLQDFSKRPFFGWSRDTQLLFSNDDLYAAHRPNGITNLLRSYGAIYFIVFFTLMFLSFKKLGNLSTMANKNAFAIFLIATILISAFSQLIFDNIFFRSTLFWGECIISINLIKRIEKTDKNLITE